MKLRIAKKRLIACGYDKEEGHSYIYLREEAFRKLQYAMRPGRKSRLLRKMAAFHERQNRALAEYKSAVNGQ